MERISCPQRLRMSDLKRSGQSASDSLIKPRKMPMCERAVSRWTARRAAERIVSAVTSASALGGRAARRLPRPTGRAFDDLTIYSAVVGTGIGLMFPAVLTAMGMDHDVAHAGSVRMACIVAGLVVAAVNVALARLVVGIRLMDLSSAMTTTRRALQSSIGTGAPELCAGTGCHLPADSGDELGRVAGDYNALVDAVVHAHQLQRAITEMTAAVASQLDVETLCRTALSELRARTGVAVAAVAVDTEIGRQVVSSGHVPATTSLTALADAALASPGAVERRRGAVIAADGWQPTMLRAHGRVLGVLLLPDEAGTSDPARERMVEVLVTGLSVALSNALAHQRLNRLASVDELTGLANRRTGLAMLTDRLAEASRGDTRFAVAIIDVDHFKAVNDGHGHQVGDLLLTHLAQVCREGLRAGDLLMRYGGEEFVAVLPGSDGDHALAAMERMRTAVARTPLLLADGNEVAVRVSIGVAARCSGSHDTIDPAGCLLRRADAALYGAKRTGRDRCVLAGTEPAP